MRLRCTSMWRFFGEPLAFSMQGCIMTTLCETSAGPVLRTASFFGPVIELHRSLTPCLQRPFHCGSTFWLATMYKACRLIVLQPQALFGAGFPLQSRIFSTLIEFPPRTACLCVPSPGSGSAFCVGWRSNLRPVLKTPGSSRKRQGTCF